MSTIYLHPSVTLYIDSSGRTVVNDEQERLWKETVMVKRRVLSQNLPEGIGGKQRIPKDIQCAA
jgi:hypothetical protein